MSTGNILIGKKPKQIGEIGAGIQFALRTYNDPQWSPRFEIWAYKLINLPESGALDKKRDIKGMWRIFWWQPRITMQKEQKIERKGFRPRKIQLPVTFVGKFRSW